MRDLRSSCRATALLGVQVLPNLTDRLGKSKVSRSVPVLEIWGISQEVFGREYVQIVTGYLAGRADSGK